MNKQMQNQYEPDEVSPPGETLAELLEERGMSQAELADRMGRPKKTINEIIQGKTAITAETAMQLELVLGTPARFWNEREYQYRHYLARTAQRECLAGQVDWLEKFPISAMIKLGWIERYRDKVNQLYELLSYFGIASPAEWQPLCDNAAFRKTTAFQSQPEALSAWLRRGEIEARQIDCQPYEARKFQQVLGQARQLTLEPPEVFAPKLVEWCAEAGVAVVFVPQLPKAMASGATRWLSPDKAIIQLSLRYKTDDHLWFSFFHEAGHILLHGKRLVFVDNEKLQGDTEEEREANDFASAKLIPPAEMTRFKGTLTPGLYPSKQAVMQFAQELGIAPSIVVGRLQHDKVVPHTHNYDLKTTLEWA